MKKVASHFSNCDAAERTESASLAVSVSATSITTTNSSASIAWGMPWLSASEWAGLALSTSSARNRFG